MTGQGTRSDHAGFTLLEVLVVVFIIGITLTLVQVNVSRGESQVLRDEALRLETLLRLVQDEVNAGGQSLALELQTDGYRFYQREQEQWRELQETPFAPHVFPETVRWGRIDQGGVVSTRLPLRLVWQAGALPPVLDVQLKTANHEERLQLDALGRVIYAASAAQ